MIALSILINQILISEHPTLNEVLVIIEFSLRAPPSVTTYPRCVEGYKGEPLQIRNSIISHNLFVS